MTSTVPLHRIPRHFAQVDTWVFDLDNTLYPHHVNLWQQVDERIRDYIAEFLKISHDDAFLLQKDYYRRYGTSMRGLMTEHGMKPDDFLDFVHQVDHSPLEPNPALGAAIEKLQGRKLILTNGTRHHAEKVLARLELETHFDDVFDIVAAELGLHRDTVACAVDTSRFSTFRFRDKARILDPYRDFIRATVEQYPRLRATRLLEMLRGRGYSGTTPPPRSLRRLQLFINTVMVASNSE